MKPDQITNALELFQHAVMFEHLTPDSVRNAVRNHPGQSFDNKPQYIAMDKDGCVYAWVINPAALISGRAREDQDLEMACLNGFWDSDIGTVSEYIGMVTGESRQLITAAASCFRIDESFTELERVECTLCNGKGSYTDQSQDVEGNTIFVDETCDDCLGAGSVPNGKG